MAAPSVTYTFSNSTTADATEVNQNFTDIINALTDGTEDLTISALTCNGAVSFNGNVTLGNATGDDITLTGRIASNLDPKTAANNTIGDATQTWRALYLDNGATDGGAVYFDASSTKFLKANAAGTDLSMGGFTHLDLVVGHSIKHFGRYLEAKSANYTITDTDGVSVINMTTGASDRTVTLPTASANTYRIITLKKVDSGAGRALLAEEGTDAIDGFSTIVVPLRYDYVTVQSNGTTWHIIDRKAFSAWTTYTPGTNGLGTIGSVAIEYRRNGNSLDIRGYFTTGIITAAEARMDTPLSTTLGGNSGITSTTVCGSWYRNQVLTTANVHTVLATRGDTYVNFSRNDGSTNQLTPQNGNAVFGNSERTVFFIRAVPIQEWTDVA